MPPVSEPQRRAMYAAAEGHSTLGIPKKVGEEFVGKARDMNPADWKGLVRGLFKWIMEEEAEPEHQVDDGANADTPIMEDESEEAKKRAEGKLSERQREDIGRVDSSKREDMPEGVFLEPKERKYPVKQKKDGEWKYDRRLLLAAAREARMHGHEDLAARADAIREREFGSANDMALDRESVRSYDADQRLHVERSNISKANVCEYLGREIPDAESMGLDPDKRYKLLRHPDELKKAVDSFNNLPILSRHVPVSADDHQPDLVIGSTGTDAEFDGKYLTNSLVFWARDAIEAIEREVQKELSSAYRYRADMTPGEFEGEKFDGIMRDICANHLALVTEGRAGPDVVVGDQAITPPDNQETTDMSNAVLSRKASVAKGAILAFLRPKLAADAKIDLNGLLVGVTNANYKDKKAGIVSGLKDKTKGKLAKDANIDDVVTLLDAMEGVEEMEGAPMDSKTMDAEGEGHMSKLMEFLKGKLNDADHAEAMKMMAGDEEDDEEEKKKREAEAKKAEDAEEDKKDDDKVTKGAMDAAIESAVKAATANAVKTQQAIREAERAVRPYVGELAIAFDSAEQVYRTALESLGVDVKGVHASALPTILSMQPKPGETIQKAKDAPVAMDAASVDSFNKMFPGANRIRTL